MKGGSLNYYGVISKESWSTGNKAFNTCRCIIDDVFKSLGLEYTSVLKIHSKYNKITTCLTYIRGGKL